MQQTIPLGSHLPSLISDQFFSVYWAFGRALLLSISASSYSNVMCIFHHKFNWNGMGNEFWSGGRGRNGGIGSTNGWSEIFQLFLLFFMKIWYVFRNISYLNPIYILFDAWRSLAHLNRGSRIRNFKKIPQMTQSLASLRMGTKRACKRYWTRTQIKFNFFSFILSKSINNNNNNENMKLVHSVWSINITFLELDGSCSKYK